jgi:hypothetical protein
LLSSRGADVAAEVEVEAAVEVEVAMANLPD